MPTFRSDSSASTTMTVSLTETGRSGNYVTVRVNWSVTLGSATSNGSAPSNNRTLYIYRNNGVLLGSGLIKNEQYWYAGQTYSGSFSFTFNAGTTLSGTWGVYIQTNNSGTQSCIWTDRDYCTDFNFSFSMYITDVTAPSNPVCNPKPYENSITCSWTAGSDGVNNDITEYRIYYKLNGGSEVLLDTNSTNTSKVIDTSEWVRGTTFTFRVISVSERGTGNPSSGWSSTATKNRVPNTPTSPSVPQSSYVPGDTIRVSFSNNGDPDGNLSGFEVATDASSTIVGSRAGSSITYVDVDTDGWDHGITRRFRVRGYDAFGIRGPWSTYTAQVTMNTAPNAPAINYPAAGSTVYRQRPHILLKAGTTNDGPKHILCINDGTEKTTALNGSAFSSGSNDSLASERQLVYCPDTDLGTGSKTLTSRMYDSFLYSSVVSRAFNIDTFSPIDPDLTIPGMKIKAVHVIDLQTAINNLRAAYGLSAYSFTSVVAGTTPIGNVGIITELQTALQGVIDRINGWDNSNATFDITVTWIDPAAAGGGVDREKLRQAIEQLRALIPAI